MSTQPGTEKYRQLAELDQMSTRRFNLLWTGPEQDITWMGKRMTLPEKNTVGPYAVVDADGDPVPGTLYVEDFIGEDWESGESRLFFDARKAVIRFLGLPERLAGVVLPQPKSFLFASGLTLLPSHPTKDDIEAARADSYSRRRVFEYERAKEEVNFWDEKNRRRKGEGRDAIPGDHSYDLAIATINKYRQEESRKLGITEDIRSKTPEITEDDLDFMVWARATLMDKVKLVVEDDAHAQASLIEDMLKKPEVKLALSKKYSIRKKGYLPEKEEDLKAQVAAKNAEALDAVV